jgi:hypothetical protein
MHAFLQAVVLALAFPALAFPCYPVSVAYSPVSVALVAPVTYALPIPAVAVAPAPLVQPFYAVAPSALSVGYTPVLGVVAGYGIAPLYQSSLGAFYGYSAGLGRMIGLPYGSVSGAVAVGRRGSTVAVGGAGLGGGAAVAMGGRRGEAVAVGRAAVATAGRGRRQATAVAAPGGAALATSGRRR